jgi:hypothetical protein
MRGGKRAVEVAHRRWGKDEVALHATACAAMERVGNYWHMLPEYEQARKSIWDAVNPHTGKNRIDEAFPRAIRKQTYKQRMMIEFANGSTWQLVGSDNYNALMGSPPIGVVFSEYSLANPLAWAYIRPILLENNGWAAFIYTARGDNHGRRLYEMAKEEMALGSDWFAQKSTVDDTCVFTKLQLEQELREIVAELGSVDEGEALFNQEYYCSFQGAIPGSYYGKVMAIARADGRIGEVPYISGHPVYTFWDLGVNDTMAIWFMQQIGDYYRFIDYVEDSRFGMDHYAHILLNEKRYLYADHFMPHDSANTSVQTGKTTAEYSEDLGIRPIHTVSRARDSQAVIAGINQGRRIFNLCKFDERKCTHGLAALSNYRSEYDKKRKRLGLYPVHDWACLAGDTMIRTLQGWKPIAELAGKDFYTWSYDTIQKRLVPAKAAECWASKIANLTSIVALDDGRQIKCTPDHLFMTRNGVWTEAGMLSPGMSLMPFYENEDRTYIKVHLTDGTIAEEHKFVYSVFNGYLEDGHHIHHLDENKLNNNPENLIKMTIAQHIGLHASSPERLEKLRNNSRHNGGNTKSTEMLVRVNKLRCGDNHHTRSPEYWTDERRNTTGAAFSNSYKRTEELKLCPVCKGYFTGNWKRTFCCTQCKSRNRTVVRGGDLRYSLWEHSDDCKLVPEKDNHKVISVEFVAGDCLVYDINVPRYHNFVAEGVVVHNSNGADAFRTFSVGFEPNLKVQTVSSLMKSLGMQAT